MNRYQKIALGIAAVNLLAIVLFPPYDQYSIANSRLPVFAGFHLAFAPLPYSEINTGVLMLEAAVVLINAGIAWLLLRDRPPPAARRRLNYQNAVLIVTGVNLVVMLLFPPFESVFALTNAALPTFEGFYFIFFQQPNHIIVTTLLYLEVLFILINGGLFWLIFKERPQQLSPADLYALASQLRGKSGK